MMSLVGRRALVTGSTAGIGRAIAGTLAAAGAAVIIHDIDRAAVATTLADWSPEEAAVAGVAADLSSDGGVAKLASEAQQHFGDIDILVHNASIEIDETWDIVSSDALIRQIRINQIAPVLLTRALLPGMIAGGWGRVLAIGSVQEVRANPRHLAYAATKAAQTSMMLTLARTLGVPGITFNVLRPGAILTDRNRATLSDRDSRAAIESRIPLGRVGTPEDCAGAALLLCSDAGAYINGAVIAIDGGLGL